MKNVFEIGFKKYGVFVEKLLSEKSGFQLSAIKPNHNNCLITFNTKMKTALRVKLTSTHFLSARLDEINVVLINFIFPLSC